MARTFSAEDEETLLRLHADGLPRNEIARQMGWAVGTITNHARRLGLDFDREAVRAATDARQVDLRDQRQQIQQELLELAREQMTRARSRYLLTGFSHTGEIVAQWMDLPPARESKDLTTAAMSALARFDQKAKDEADNTAQLSAVDRFLQGVMGELPEQDR
ncbi:hypothetical protein AB0L66_11535 [Streptomyces sp. NPDC052207]|uniref:hypothetical protein n=1 Tax=Streptomyces sp. NPDC052207 TaxID=3155418 RepID=UPI00342B1910